jgi:hypothetical protein
VIFGDDSAESDYAGGSDGTAFHAAGGRDRFSGSSGDDWFDAGAGTDMLLFIGEGADRCDSVDVFDPPETEGDCETVLP